MEGSSPPAARAPRGAIVQPLVAPNPGTTGSIRRLLRPSSAEWFGQYLSRSTNWFGVGTGACLSFGLVLAAWGLISQLGLVTPFLLPSPATVARTGVGMVLDGTLFRHIGVSATRVMVGFGLGALVAIPFAAVMAVSRPLRELLQPPLDFLRLIPPLGMVPLLILWFGIGEASKIAVIILSAFFPLFLGTIGGMTQCDPKLIEVGRMCGLSRREIFVRIVLPSAMAPILVGVRLSLGYCWRALVGAELIAASVGLGHMIVDAETLARTDIIMVGIITIGVLGLLLDWVALILARSLAPWVKEELELGRA